MSRQGRLFTSFLPAMSGKAAKAIRQTIRRWRLHLRSDLSLEDLAQWCNPVLRGWINYYSCFHKSAMYTIFNHLDRVLVRWAARKYKRFGRKRRKAYRWLQSVKKKQPELFVHWLPWQNQAGQ